MRAPGSAPVRTVSSVILRAGSTEWRTLCGSDSPRPTEREMGKCMGRTAWKTHGLHGRSFWNLLAKLWDYAFNSAPSDLLSEPKP